MTTLETEHVLLISNLGGGTEAATVLTLMAFTWQEKQPHLQTALCTNNGLV
jgi:hypothetical protein